MQKQKNMQIRGCENNDRCLTSKWITLFTTIRDSNETMATVELETDNWKLPIMRIT